MLHLCNIFPLYINGCYVKSNLLYKGGKFLPLNAIADSFPLQTQCFNGSLAAPNGHKMAAFISESNITKPRPDNGKFFNIGKLLVL